MNKCPKCGIRENYKDHVVRKYDCGSYSNQSVFKQSDKCRIAKLECDLMDKYPDARALEYWHETRAEVNLLRKDRIYLESKVAQLEAALKPFSKYAERFHAAQPEQCVLLPMIISNGPKVEDGFTVGDLRAAHLALNPPQTAPGSLSEQPK